MSTITNNFVKRIKLKNVTLDNLQYINDTLSELNINVPDCEIHLTSYYMFMDHVTGKGDLSISVYDSKILENPKVRELLLEYLI